jgi:hypothetical protein
LIITLQSVLAVYIPAKLSMLPLAAGQMFSFYHKVSSHVKELSETAGKQAVPFLWKLDVFVPDFHSSGNTA